MSCNGMLAGLVAITAPCAFVAPWAACRHWTRRRLSSFATASGSSTTSPTSTTRAAPSRSTACVAPGASRDRDLRRRHLRRGLERRQGRGHGRASTATAVSSSLSSRTSSWASSSRRHRLRDLRRSQAVHADPGFGGSGARGSGRARVRRPVLSRLRPHERAHRKLPAPVSSAQRANGGDARSLAR